ncbi:MAG: hypothetical protein APR62_13395 [Smithella sp. SDB]|nr:MAG: hypothetical protein APR62_13395 [Smithella sp. SDB]
MIELPKPFIVGVSRSGTTLLRLMFDAHPDMTIPPETHFIRRLNLQCERKDFFSIVTSEVTWADFHIDKTDFKQALSRIKPFSVTEGLRCFYRLYAQKHGKKYVGDKTPVYSQSMITIQRMLPEARFIHLIRDGRDVALSQKGLWFGPGDNIDAAAEFWVSRIQLAREQAPLLKYYMEVKFEELILDPTNILINVCNFLEIPFSEQMLSYYINAKERLNELEDHYHAGRSLLIKKEDLLSLFKLTEKSPDRNRVFCWKNQMPETDQISYEKIAGRLLADLGYETRFTEFL